MPIYEYECNACGDLHEFIQKFSESPKRKCPSCGKSRLRKLISAAAFHLKGAGWYVTDFRDGNKKQASDGGESSTPAGESAASTESTGKSEDKPQGKSESSAEGKTENKPTGKSESKSEVKSTAKKEKTSSKSANR